MDLREVEHGINQWTHWYYCSKSIPMIRFTKNIIKSQSQPLTIIDVGAGTGYFSQVLDKKFGNKISKIILVDINYTDAEVNESKGKRIEKMKHFPDEISNSIILMMDVLEHIEKDSAFLNELLSKTKGTNYYFITVPAFMSLWSYHDEYLLHYRRYTLKNLKQVTENAGIKTISGYYLYFALFPLAWLVRRVLNKNRKEGNDMKQPSGIVNNLLKYFFSIEMSFRKLNKIAGLTCCIEGKKTERN